MTSQNTQRYQPYNNQNQYRQSDGQWDSTTTTTTTQTQTATPNSGGGGGGGGGLLPPQNPPIVPARGIKKFTGNDVPATNRPYDDANWMDNNILQHECNRLRASQNNMNITTAAVADFRNNQLSNMVGGTAPNNAPTTTATTTTTTVVNSMTTATDHDVNVNCVQSPLRTNSKFTPYVCFDDSVMDATQGTVLSSCRWFHGKISRDDAENLLQPKTDGLFLIRESTNFPGDYTLCVCFQNKVEHYRVKRQAGKITIDDEEFFANLEELIEHYEKDADGLCTKLVEPLNYGRIQLVHKAKQPSEEMDLCIIPEQELEIREPIGKGEFCEVKLGFWKNSKVAVKVLKDSSEAEAILMKSLHHENLVNLLGIVRKKDQIYLITEFMSKGSLVDYLRSRGRQHVTKKDQINFAFDTSLGMEYLEEMHVVHRDLAARNVLIAENGRAKVSDFGLARREKHATSESAKLPIKWTAPEALKQNKFSNKSDMWSFGILLWEIYSFGRVPYPRIPLADVVKHVEKGYKMESPEGCPSEVYDIMRQAWDLDPEKRPKFSDVKIKLQQLMSKLHSEI